MTLHIAVDAVCLVYMSLSTYAVIKLCLTATFKMIRKNPEQDAVSTESNIDDQWIYTTQGVPHRMRKMIMCAVLMPIVIAHDICY